MVLLPLRTVSLASDLAPPALVPRLRLAIGEGPGQPFSGSVTDAGFVITRLREFRSTAMPVLRGQIAPAPGGGAAVRLRLAPARIVVVFMVIWLGFLGAVAALVVASHALDARRSLLWLLAPGGLAALSWHVMGSVFAADARWALEHLLERLPALRPETPAEVAGTCRENPHL
ncbi:MAG TPA: hypothetical protein VI078_01285 [bacterium]